jgi:hypothetical protein
MSQSVIGKINNTITAFLQSDRKKPRKTASDFPSETPSVSKKTIHKPIPVIRRLEFKPAGFDSEVSVASSVTPLVQSKRQQAANAAVENFPTVVSLNNDSSELDASETSSVDSKIREINDLPDVITSKIKLSSKTFNPSMIYTSMGLNFLLVIMVLVLLCRK